MANDKSLRVTRIQIEKLFGRYDHDVRLRPDRITIIHGPNGVGKTVLLRLVAAALSGNLSEVIKIPFERFEVTFSNDSVLGFERMALSQKGDPDKQLEDPGFIGRCYLKAFGSNNHEMEIKANQVDIRRWAARIESELPWMTRIDRDRYMDGRAQEIITSVEVVSRYSEYLPGKPTKKGIFSIPEWLSEIQSRVGVHLIETQRLLRLQTKQRERDYREYWAKPGAPETYMATVKSYAKDLQAQISELLASYAKQSQALDQSFPQRLLESRVKTLTADELKQRMQELESKRQQLKRIRLIADDSAYPFDVNSLEKLDETRRTVMTLYVDDTATKLGVLDELARRIEILLGNINSKFRHKQILVDRINGLVAVTDNGSTLNLDSLSSGEQHELVLLYDLLFRVKENTLVLIDEPELSLHVTWQKKFLPDLLEIVATAGYDVLLATHSPSIVGDHHDLMVSLYADTDEQKVEF